MWQLKRDGKVLAEHSTEIACATEAFERGLVQRMSIEASHDIRGKRLLAEGVTIEKRD